MMTNIEYSVKEEITDFGKVWYFTDTGKQSILSFISQSDYITLKGNKITINNLSSLSIRCVIAHNLPSKTTQNIFANTINK